jgi:hypothetical protein
MTHVDNQGCGDTEDVSDYEKYIATQKEFWNTCTSLFIFRQQFYSKAIVQSIPAKDKCISHKLKAKIVKSVKAELLQIGDMN